MPSHELNRPHGKNLVNRITDESAVKKQNLPILRVGQIVESDFLNIATGVFSPLTGFMGKMDFESVCHSSRLQDPHLVWTIPITFDVDQADLNVIASHSKVLLQSENTGRLIGYIEPLEVYANDKNLRIRSTFGTEDDSHPGVAQVLNMKPHLLAGKITAFREALEPDPLSYPDGVRKRLQEMGLKTVAGFQTRNVVHRAHEYLQRIALEICDGLLIHPVVGWKKSGDFRLEVVKDVYERFIADFYNPQSAVLAFLNVAMRYAGPKEAVFHAIIRKNYGCSHFIVGRDHAGVGGFYDKYAAHRIFDSLPDLGITILKLCGPYYCRKCGLIVTEKTCGHDLKEHEEISGTKVRDIISRGQDPQHHFLRQEVLDYLEPFRREGKVFYE